MRNSSQQNPKPGLDIDLERAIRESEEKALDNLARHKFMNFGYWSAINVHLRHLEGKNRRSPFSLLVKQARAMISRNKSLTND